MNNTAIAPVTISKRAYNEFVERINNVFGNNDDNDYTTDVISLIDNYLSGTDYDLSQYAMSVRIAFLMILPEIQKAANRSRKAKEAAAKRHKKSGNTAKKKKVKSKTIKPQTSAPDNKDNEVKTSDISEQEIATIKPNRAERRLAEQNERREERRWMKRLAKWRKELKIEANKKGA